MTQFKCEYGDITNTLDQIMVTIQELLDENSIKYTVNASNTEIQIKNKEKKEISGLIESLNLQKVILYLLIEITYVKGNVYIRKKIG